MKRENKKEGGQNGRRKKHRDDGHAEPQVFCIEFPVKRCFSSDNRVSCSLSPGTSSCSFVLCTRGSPQDCWRKEPDSPRSLTPTTVSVSHLAAIHHPDIITQTIPLSMDPQRENQFQDSASKCDAPGDKSVLI
ncbi:hypothetical protein KM043_016272 [Ampulex compressa]|nr:hypothetical protein KM043_016272 [Ampulex compressa]